MNLAIRTLIRILLYTALVYALLQADNGDAQDTKSSKPTINVEAEYLTAARKYKIDPILFKSVLIVESNLDHEAVNAITLDFGIGQINYRTAEAYDIDIVKLRHDRAYSIDRAAFVLSEHKRLYTKRLGAAWICSYNQGWRANQTSGACKAYLLKLSNARTYSNL